MAAATDVGSLSELLARLESPLPPPSSTSSDAKWQHRLRAAMLSQAQLSLSRIEHEGAAPEAEVRRLRALISRATARLPDDVVAARRGNNEFSQVQVKVQPRPSASAIRRRQILTRGLYDDVDEVSSSSSDGNESDSSVGSSSSASSYSGGADELNPIRARAIAAGHTWTADPLLSGTPSSSASADGHGSGGTSLSVPPRGPGLVPQRKPSITITDVDRAPNHSRLLEDDELHGQEEEDEYAAYEAAAAEARRRELDAKRARGEIVDQDEDLDEKSTIQGHHHGSSSIAGDSEKTETEPNEGGNPALQSDRALQDSLSSELLRMAQALKSNSLAFASALERDRKLVEESTGKLEVNLDIMTRTRGRLGVYSKKARSLGWTTLGAIVMVVVSWVVMFVIIRLT